MLEGLNSTGLPVNPSDKSLAESVLENVSVPTTRVEAWKYTRLAKLSKKKYQQNSSVVESINSFSMDENAHTLVFVNGVFNAELSSKASIDGVKMNLLSDLNEIPSAQTKIEGEIFNAMNTAFLSGGVEVLIEKNKIIEKAIQIIHIIKEDASIANFRTNISIAKSSQAEVHIGYFSENGENKFCNVNALYSVGENSNLTVNKVQYEDESTFHISTEEVRQDKNSVFTLNTSTLNGALVRNNVHVEVNGENCVSNLNGVYLLKNKQHVDNHTVVDHKVPHCESHELYKGVMDDKSTAVFNGKVYVRPDAQKINAFQSNGNVLLSDDATVNSKPELEIYADDVKCSHGSTTGQLDDEAIFYLQARGISKRSAHQLLVAAFIGEVLDKIESENFRLFINGILKERFDWE